VGNGPCSSTGISLNLSWLGTVRAYGGARRRKARRAATGVEPDAHVVRPWE
jgi:hypothetical protein